MRKIDLQVQITLLFSASISSHIVHMCSSSNRSLHTVLFSDSSSRIMATGPPALCRSSGPSRNLWLDHSLWAVLGCGVMGLGPFPASSSGRWTGSCPEISAHLVRRSQPPVKRGHSSALSPISTVYRATGASGWR